MIRTLASPILLACATALLAASPAPTPISRWDALPALDVVHLRGPHAGTDVCPMCRHGYDAGLLVQLPASTPPEIARASASRLAAVARHINDARFRSFILIDGSPSPALLDALESDAPAWHIARRATDRPRERARIAPENGAIGYVFAQRRAILAFDPHDDDARVQAHADYAMVFLRETYADAVTSPDPDTPKGRLWLAPNRLPDHTAMPPSQRACLVDTSGTPLPSTLVAVRTSPIPQRQPWMRTDGAGCLRLARMDAGSTVDAEVFRLLDASVFVRLDGDPRDDSGRPRLRSVNEAVPVSGHERIVGQPCEGCEGIFVGRPATFVSTALLAPADEPGERLHLSGIVRDESGQVREGIVLLAYQTDLTGHYTRDGAARRPESAHARLRAFARTDSSGRYAFESIRPAAYPDRSMAAHIHLHVLEPGRCTYYIGDVMFDDDPLLSAALRSREQSAHGGNGIVVPVRDERGRWQVTRDIELGLHVADYADCAPSRGAGGEG